MLTRLINGKFAFQYFFSSMFFFCEVEGVDFSKSTHLAIIPQYHQTYADKKNPMDLILLAVRYVKS